MKNTVKNNLLVLRIPLLLGLLIMIGFSACNDDAEEQLTEETIIEETAFAANVFTDLEYDVEEALAIMMPAGGRVQIGERLGECVEKNLDEPEDGGFPKVITLIFSGDCEYPNGRNKRGTIQITISGPGFEIGSEVKVEFLDFYVNNHQIEGTRVRIRSGEYQWTSAFENGKLITPEGDVFTREANHVHTIIAGMETIARFDNVVEITGSANGIGPNGMAYSKTITVPLISARDCPWIKAGVIVTLAGEQERMLDFGDGTCDNEALLTIDGESETITMDCKVKRKVRWWRRR